MYTNKYVTVDIISCTLSHKKSQAYNIIQRTSSAFYICISSIIVASKTAHFIKLLFLLLECIKFKFLDDYITSYSYKRALIKFLKIHTLQSN